MSEHNYADLRRLWMKLNKYILIILTSVQSCSNRIDSILLKAHGFDDVPVERLNAINYG